MRILSFLFLASAAVLTTGGTLLVGAQVLPVNEAPEYKLPSEGFAPMFPFPIVKGAPGNITDVRTWSGVKPAGSDGFLRIEGNQFVSDKGPVKFLATNLCMSGAFPEKKADAERLALSMSRFGVNCVRLHHMDMREIWGTKNQTDIDPVKLDRLDYLIHCFHQQGIYVNINLHVSRKFDDRDGFPLYDERPSHDKGLDNYEPRMIELQKKYAKDLLTHVNPYTGKAYINDPGVAMIEINNENSVVRSFGIGALDKLPDMYRVELQKRWNQWLKRKYATTAALNKAWGCVYEPISDDYTPDGSFAADFNPKAMPWEIQADQVCRFATEVYAGADELVKGQNVLKLKIDATGGQAWIPQMHRRNITIKKGQLYTLCYKIRGSKETQCGVAVLEHHANWEEVGLRTTQKITTDWQNVQIPFVGTSDDDNCRLSFSLFEPGTTIELADVHLCRGGRIGFANGETLEAGTIPAPKVRRIGVTDTEKADQGQFFLEMEDGYWQDLYHYVKDELKAQQPITGTQLEYGFDYPQAELDYCDIHSYWNHPSFPGNAWDGNNWYVRNLALVNAGAGYSTINNLAARRVLNRPLTVSEYDHPYPNMFCGEGLPMIFAVAAFQDWSGVFHFSWRHNQEYEPEYIPGFFDIAGNTGKLAHLGLCWAMLCRGDVTSGPVKFAYSVPMTQKQEMDGFVANPYWNRRNNLNQNKALTMAIYSGTNLTELSAPAVFGRAKSGEKKTVKLVQDWSDLPAELGSPDVKWVRSDSGELYYNFDVEQKGYFTVSAPKAKLFTGFANGRTIDLGGGVTLKPGKTRLDWSTVSMVEAKPNQYLITATGVELNTNQKLLDRGDGRFMTRGGDAPALLEGVPAELELPFTADQIQVFALDNAGNRKLDCPVKVESRNGRAVVVLDPACKTIWYELIRK